MAPKYAVIDFETYYDNDYSLRKMTPVEYILDRRFEMNVVAICEGDDGEPFTLEHDQFINYVDYLRGKNVAVLSHNALFDMGILAWRYGWTPPLMVDTMGMARALIYPQTGSVSLATCVEYFGVGKKGGFLANVRGMYKSEIKARGLWAGHCRYAMDDAVQERDIFKAMRPHFPRSEYAVMDQVLRCVVQPSFELDGALLQQHLAEVVREKAALLESTGLNDRKVLMSNDRFADVLRQLGVEPPVKISPATGNETYAFAKSDKDFVDLLENHPDPRVQAVCAARLGHKSTLEETRTQRFINIAGLQWGDGKTGHMPMPLRYSGAHTHRLSGDWKLNVQNLGRNSKLRHALKAPPGMKVVAVDASQIEARMNGWFSGEEELVRAFAAGEDIYSLFAGEAVYGYPVSKATHKEERFIGKQCLAAGTLVVTDKGLVCIEDITTDHRVWDGEEWVCHQGLLFNGWKPTLQLCGIWLTPDHPVLCGTQWLEAQLLEQDGSILCRALDTAAGCLPSPDTSPASGEASSPSSSGATAAGRGEGRERRLKVYDIACAGPRHRFMVMTPGGPLIVHNCILGLGYNMGAPKFQNTVRVASRNELKRELIMPMEECQRIVTAYRTRYRNITSRWKELQHLLPAMTMKGFRQEMGPVTFIQNAIVLPNGMTLQYHNLHNVGDGQWAFNFGKRLKFIYGGKMLENIIQALARICTMDAAVRVAQRFHNHGVRLASQVHDEIVFVVPEWLAEEVRLACIEEMRRRPWWGPAIPLDAEGACGATYGDCK